MMIHGQAGVPRLGLKPFQFWTGAARCFLSSKLNTGPGVQCIHELFLSFPLSTGHRRAAAGGQWSCSSLGVYLFLSQPLECIA